MYKYIFMYLFIYVFTFYLCVYVYTYVHTLTYIDIQTYIHKYTCIYIYIYIYIHTYISPYSTYLDIQEAAKPVLSGQSVYRYTETVKRHPGLVPKFRVQVPGAWTLSACSFSFCDFCGCSQHLHSIPRQNCLT